MKRDVLNLLPLPRSVKLTEEDTPSDGLAVKELLSSEGLAYAGDEAYRIVIRKGTAELVARSETGLRWARATLAQLRMNSKIPCLEIDDAPLFKNRGVMLDISRDRVPTMRTLFELVEKIASWKMNHLQLYVEHTLAYSGHEDVWRSSSPISLEELSALDHYCREKGVALTANQNCLGHFERWLKHPRYAPLAETACAHLVRDDFFVFPNTLCPLDPKVLPLIEDLLLQQIPLCSGEYVNIGCDEPWDLGHGRSKDACAKEGKEKIFSRYLARVAEIVRKLGKRPQYWCDPEPNEDSEIPRDLVALIWGYEDITDFSVRATAHLAQEREIWMVPGTSCWNSCTGRTWNRRGNLDNAANEKRASGFLCAAWGDGGHRQPWPLTLFGFADAAMAAWSGAGKYSDTANGLHAFGSGELGVWLAKLGNLDIELCKGEKPAWGENEKPSRIHNATALWKELDMNLFVRKGAGDTAAWEEVASRIESLRRELPENLPQVLREECIFSLDMSKWITERAILRRKGLAEEKRKELAARMAELIAVHRAQWLKRSRYGGLEDSCARFAKHAIQW